MMLSRDLLTFPEVDCCDADGCSDDDAADWLCSFLVIGCANRRGDRVCDVAMLAGLRSGDISFAGGIGLSWSMCTRYRDGSMRLVRRLTL